MENKCSAQFQDIPFGAPDVSIYLLHN